MKTKEKILTAADSLFGSVGFDAASTREIAERSGVNKALIYYHFKTKEALLGMVLERHYRRLVETVEQAIGQAGSFRDRMIALVTTYMEFLSENRNFSRIVQREASGGSNLDLIRGHMKPLFDVGRRMLEEQFPSTRHGVLAADQLLISFFGLIVSYFSYLSVVETLMEKDPLASTALDDRKRHVLAVLDIMIDAIRRQEQGEDHD